MQDTTQVSTAVKPSAFGELAVTELKMLTKTRKSVTKSAMRPGTTSGGTMKDIQETITNRPEQEFDGERKKEAEICSKCSLSTNDIFI